MGELNDQLTQQLTTRFTQPEFSMELFKLLRLAFKILPDVFCIYDVLHVYIHINSWEYESYENTHLHRFIMLWNMGLSPHTENCGLHMRRECWERFPRHRRSRHSRRMQNPQFYASDKGPWYTIYSMNKRRCSFIGKDLDDLNLRYR